MNDGRLISEKFLSSNQKKSGEIFRDIEVFFQLKFSWMD